MKKTKRKIVITLLVVLTLCILTGVFWLFFWSPAATWDHSPEARILYTSPNMREIPYGEIPTVQVWGDGHIIWVTYTEDKHRQVWEGYLSEKQMEDLINQFIEANFFTYRGYTNHDSSGDDYNFRDYININLTGGKHSEVINPDDPQIYQLINYLCTGAGIEGGLFTPVTGQLFAFPIEDLEGTEFPYTDVNTYYTWPDEEFGYTLESISADGYSIESDQINYVWEIVNSSAPFVESEGKIYWIALTIPGISY